MAAANHIPLEIVEEILIHLLVKALVRFRCVSKHWRSLITESSFIRKHLNLSQKTLIIGNEGRSDRVEFCCFPLSTTIQQQQPAVEYLRCPFLGEKLNYYWLLMATCDGLLVLWHDDLVYIWNPCLNNAYRLIFPPTSGSTNFLGYSSVKFDFGYDSTVDDYKLFMLSFGMGSGLRIETRVFSLRSESWTKLDNYPDDYGWPSGTSVFVNGSFHWIGQPKQDAYLHTLLSFDLSEGKYGEAVPLPLDYGDHDEFQHVIVEPCVFEGMLGVMVEYWESPRVLLWVMKKKDNDQCRRGEWTKILDITLANDVDIRRRMHVTPLYMDENGEVKMGLFSRVLGNYRSSPIENRRSAIFVHVESLISPGQICQKSRKHIDAGENLRQKDDKFFLLTHDKYVHN